jgi:hypothetical protein
MELVVLGATFISITTTSTTTTAAPMIQTSWSREPRSLNQNRAARALTFFASFRT